MVRLSILVPVTLCVLSLEVTAQEWNQFLGPRRDGIASELDDSTGRLPLPRVVWKREIGEGYTTPIMADG